MNVATIVASLVFATLLTVAAVAAEGPVPPGWIVAGSKPAAYQVGTAPQGGQFRGPAGFIRSKQDVQEGFGTLMQTIDAADYRGQRVRFSAVVRSEDVSSWAGLWMRVDGQDKKILAFDNMQSRPIRGTTGWTRHEVVLDVAPNAVQVAFGILLGGNGAAWIDDAKVEAVPNSVPTTVPERDVLPRQPRNLNFGG